MDTEHINKFFEISINIAWFSLPIFQAITFFVIEKSFKTFEFAKQNLIDHFRRIANIISLNLFYIIIQSIFFLLSLKILSLFFFIWFLPFSLVLKIRLLCLTWLYETMNSTKFIPQNFSKFKKYIRTIENNKWIEKFKFWAYLVFIFIIPLYFLLFWENYIFVSVFIVLIYTLYSIVLLFNSPLEFQDILLKSEENTWYKEIKWDDNKVEKEKKLIEKQINDSKYKILDIKEYNRFDYQLLKIILRNTWEFHSNINLLNIDFSNRELLISSINSFSKEYLLFLSNCITDINVFKLSFHFELWGDFKNVFIRASRNEIERLKELHHDDFIDQLKSKIVDEVFL